MAGELTEPKNSGEKMVLNFTHVRDWPELSSNEIFPGLDIQDVIICTTLRYDRLTGLA